VLALNAVLVVIWLLALVRRGQVQRWLAGLPPGWHYGLIAVTGAGIFAFWMTSFEAIARQYLAMTWLAFALLLVRSLPNRPLALRWHWLLLVLVALFLLPMFITAATGRAFSPDEATWADYASSPFVAGGMYVRTWLREPLIIEPGRGWSTLLYGWLLQNVAFDIWVGRVFNFVGYLLAFAGIGAVTARLYGRTAAIFSVAFAVLSRSFIVSLDYRPDHQLPLALMLIMLCVLQARQTDNKIWRRLLHIAAGLLATLTLQIHAAAVVFIAAFSLFYAAEFVLASYHKRGNASPGPMLYFGGAVALGLLLFYWLNIAPVGGLDVYLEHLLRDRWAFDLTRRTPFLRWVTLSEWLIILAALGYLLWRHAAADRQLLSIIACIVISIFVLDSQGYRTTFNALYVIPVGTLIADGFRSSGLLKRSHLHGFLVGACVLFMLMSQMSGSFVNWQTFGNWLSGGELPSFYYSDLRAQIAPYVQEGDVIVGTHELIWTFPDKLDLYAYPAEALAMERWGLSDTVEVWERVQPTLVIEVTNQRFDTGLLRYMEQRGFQVCENLDTLDPPINLYRQTCT